MNSGKYSINNRININSSSDCKSEISASSPRVEFHRVLQEPDTKWILCLITYNSVIIYYLSWWITSTNSIALKAYVITVFFNIFSLLVCLISIWVSTNSKNLKPGIESYKIVEEGSNGRDKYLSILGFEKYEVLAILLSSIVVIIAQLLLALEATIRIDYQPNIHTGSLGLCAILGFFTHLITIILYPDAGLNHVVSLALPCVTLKGCNPILACNFLSAIVLCASHIIIHFWDVHMVDTAAAIAVIGLTTTSILPLAFYTFIIILKKVPWDMKEELDKCLCEALNIDGVLEFRNERFWIKSFGKLAGTLDVRIRRNANEDYVLENVIKCLSKLVSSLHVQEFCEGNKINSPVITEDYKPPEYYINEILECREKKLNYKKNNNNNLNDKINSEWNSRWSDSMNQELMRVIKIDEIFSMSTLNIDDNQTNKKIIKNSLFNQNINVDNVICRQNLLNKNQLFLGMKIDIADYQNRTVDDNSLNLIK